MRYSALLFAAALPLLAQSDAIVAEVNGQKLTAEDVKKILAGTPAQARATFFQNPEQFMKEYAWYKHIEGLAARRKLDEQSPYRELLEFNRMLTLVQAMYNQANTDVVVQREEEKAYYDANKDKFREVQAKLIYIPFSAEGDGKKVLNEAAAKAKAETIVKQARGSADFVKLVKEHSEDPGSVAQNGDVGTGVRSTTAHIPEPMRKAVLALQPGQVSDPVRHENGYYVFRAESADVLPYEKVREEIYKELKTAGFRKWQQKTQAESSFKVTNEELFRTLAKEPPKEQ